jgi:hypothetical protein
VEIRFCNKENNVITENKLAVLIVLSILVIHVEGFPNSNPPVFLYVEMVLEQNHNNVIAEPNLVVLTV